MAPLEIEDRYETHLLNFCPVCLAATQLPRHIVSRPEIQWNRDFPVRMHLLCRLVITAAGIKANGKNIKTLVKTEAPLRPLPHGIHNARAIDLMRSRTLECLDQLSGKDELIDAIVDLPVEIRLMIVNYSIPSFFAACCTAKGAVPLLKRRAPATRESKLDLQRWPRFETSMINSQSYITTVNIKDSAGLRDPTTTFVFKFDDTGCSSVSEHKDFKSGTVLTKFDRSASSFFRILEGDWQCAPKVLFKGAVIRDVSSDEYRSIFWDIPHKIEFKEHDAVRFWKHNKNHTEPIHMRLLDNTRPLDGLTILSETGTVAVIFHHQNDDINLLPRLLDLWPNATIQYWPLENDHIFNFGSRTPFEPLSSFEPFPDLFFTTTNGLLLQSGPHFAESDPTYLSQFVFKPEQSRPAYIAISEPNEFDQFLRFGAAEAITVGTTIAFKDLNNLNDCSFCAKPSQIRDMVDVCAWKIDLDDGYDQCYMWHRDPDLEDITGIMFESLDGRKRAVLGQWRRDCKPVGPFLLSDDIMVENTDIGGHRAVPGSECAVVLAEPSEWSISLSGKLFWWGGRRTNMIGPMPTP